MFEMTSELVKAFPTLVELARWRSENHPTWQLYTFLENGHQVSGSLTFADLEHHARAIAATLQDTLAPGDRVLLVFPAGLEFITAFFGCLFSGAVAVPAPPPEPGRLHRTLHRLQAISVDARPRVALTTSGMLSHLEQFLPDLPGLRALTWLAVDKQPLDTAARWHAPPISPTDLAFLQYSSGSTGSPRGVMVPHGKLLQHLEVVSHAWAYTADSVSVTWMPNFHDYGLIEGLLHPVFRGIHCVLMSPLTLLQRPISWLEAITRYRGTHTAGPNFAYDLCVRKSTLKQRQALDLSCWRTAGNAAETVRAETLDRFFQAFQPYGLRWRTLYPSYGLAEATLVVSAAGPTSEGPRQVYLEAGPLEQHRVVLAPGPSPSTRTIVGCGHPVLNTRIVIVHPDTLARCAEDEIGEIWVSSPTIAQGYWGRAEESEETFRACTSDNGEGPFLRTGDLGFLYQDELYMTGRLKDIIILAGRNHYPQDIERTIEELHPAMRQGCSAAFSIEYGGEEQLVLVAEIEPEALEILPEQLCADIRQAIAEAHGIDLYALWLLPPRTIPKTSSGKSQHHACRVAFLERALESCFEWRRPDGGTCTRTGVHPDVAGTETTVARLQHSRQAIVEWLQTHLSARTGLPAEAIDPRLPFSRLGLSSREQVSLSGELGAWLDIPLPPTLFWDQPSIDQLASHLVSIPERASGPRAPIPARTGEAQESIAIVGMACRFPGADGLEAYWHLLRDGVDAVREVPESRHDLRRLFEERFPDWRDRSARLGGYLDRVDQFDAAFFDVVPREAVCMDPQQRLLLEVSWEALENAGIPLPSLAGSRTGVFVGIANGDYGRLQLSEGDLHEVYATTGSVFSIAANRLSYVFNLRGPSMAVDTACSSSLVAVHLACRSLRSGESSLALAGGVNLILSPELTFNFTRAGLLSEDGRCKTFDARANGYVRGEGAGVVVLKRLSEALRDGDRIHAVIRGTAVNNDGGTNGLLAPSAQAQQRVLRDAQRDAGVTASQLRYVEAHGTGTSLGDQIEAGALGTVLAEGRPPANICAVGSVKTNLGHLEAAAGIAGLMKVALSLSHRWLPPSLHFQTPNPHIDFEQLPLRVQEQGGPWPEGTGPLLAGVSSFGFGGTNAHAILEEASSTGAETVDQPPATPDSPRPLFLPLSARSPQALAALVRRWRERLTSGPEEPASSELEALTRAATLRRTHHDLRFAVVGPSRHSLIDGLDRFEERAAEAHRPGRAAHQRLPIVFVFPGQGSQWSAMGRTLLKSEPVFRRALEDCAQAMRPWASWNLLDVLTRPEDDPAEQGIDVLQPVLFAMEVALAALWRHWGIEPDAVVGHSMGEVAAAYVAGALSLEDAARVICRRSQLLRSISGQGAMAVIEWPRDKVQQRLAQCSAVLSVAACNGPSTTVVAGDGEALNAFLISLQQENVFCRLVRVDVASHSPQMDPLIPELVAALEGIAPRTPVIPFISTVTTRSIIQAETDAVYWARNLREPVLFVDVIEQLLQSGPQLFLEISPHPLLVPSLEQAAAKHGYTGGCLPSLRREEDERTVLLESLATLYTRGHNPRWERVFEGPCRIVDLPGYPWQHRRWWLELAPHGQQRASHTSTSRSGSPPLLGRYFSCAHPVLTHGWELVFEPQRMPWLFAHRLEEVPVSPASMLLECVLEAGSHLYGQRALRLEQTSLVHPLFLDPNAIQSVQIILTPLGAHRASFHVYSRTGTERTVPWTLHATGTIQHLHNEQGFAEDVDLTSRIDLSGDTESGDSFYQILDRQGIHYDTPLRGIASLRRTRMSAAARLVESSDQAIDRPAFILPPISFDAGFQLLAGLLDRCTGNASRDHRLVPASIEAVTCTGLAGLEAWSYASLEPGGGEASMEVRGHFQLLTSEGRPLASVEGITLKVLPRSVLTSHRAARSDDWLYREEWVQQPPVARSRGEAPRRWLVFADRQGVAARTAHLLTEQGIECRLLFTGDRSRILEDGRIELNPFQPEQARALLESLLKAWSDLPVGILHGWSLNACPSVSLTSDALAEAQALGCGSLLWVIQAVLASKAAAKLWILTCGAHPLPGAPETPQVAQAPAWGLGRVLALEHPNHWGGLIDVDLSDSTLAESLGRELMEWTPEGEDQVLLRGASRWCPRLKPGKPAPSTSTLPVRSDGTYLITGGLGRLGLRVARWLVQNGARHLALISRRGLEPHEADAWQGTGAGRAAAAAEVKAMKSLGASITVYTLDVAREDQLSACLEAIRNTSFPLKGVIHAAAALSEVMIQEMTLESLNAMFRAKVMGTWQLHQQTQALPLDFFVCFSSTTALWGSAGLAHYAAANAFQDAISHLRHQLSLPALTINWGTWDQQTEDHLQGVQQSASFGLIPMPSDQALGWLARLLGASETRVAIASVDWNVLKSAYEARRRRPFLEHVVAKPAPGAGESRARGRLVQQLEQLEPDKRWFHLQRQVQLEVASVLGREGGEEIAIRQGFFQMGMNSLMSVQLKSRLESLLGSSLPSTLALNYPTVEALAGYLAQEILPRQGVPFPDAGSAAANQESPVRTTAPADVTPPPPGSRPEASLATRLDRIEDLSDEEVERLLAIKLAQRS